MQQLTEDEKSRNEELSVRDRIVWAGVDWKDSSGDFEAAAAEEAL